MRWNLTVPWVPSSWAEACSVLCGWFSMNILHYFHLVLLYLENQTRFKKQSIYYQITLILLELIVFHLLTGTSKMTKLS